MRCKVSTRVLLLGTTLSLALGALLAACATAGTAGSPLSTSGATPVDTANTVVTTTGTVAHTTATAGSTSLSPSASQGVIEGRVASGGNCSATDAATPCPGQPAAGYTVTIQTQVGALVATATSDVAGHFTVSVAPGTYLVQPRASAGKGLVRVIPSGPLTVSAGAIIPVQIILETSVVHP